MLSSHCFIIAEAGVNHNGDLELAKRLVQVAREAGADAVKFQTFVATEIAAASAPKAGYQVENTGTTESQVEMLKKFELSPEAHRELMAEAEKQGIKFMSTPFDLPSVELLNQLGLDIFKIASGEITNLPYLRAIGRLNKRVILSTGMATLEEVRAALLALEKAGTSKEQITVLHCHTDYPTKPEDVNLRAMLTIRDELGVQVGYSDHTPGIEMPIAAVALGAQVIEKHFTLDRSMPGPDHRASLEPRELCAMITAIRNIEKAMGDGVKRPTLREQEIMKVARKSIVAAREIKAGEVFTKENITTKRPGTGISPMRWDQVIGGAAKKIFLADEMVEI